MTHFDHLRTVPWSPQFKWVGSSVDAADLINSFHEDYPKYVVNTLKVIHIAENFIPLWDADLQMIHLAVFNDKPFGGCFRGVNVRVGPHIAPDWEQVKKLMVELWQHYVTRVESVERLTEWYTDFNTIHPFQDGNGRVSGIVLAIISHQLEPEKGWLAPLQ